MSTEHPPVAVPLDAVELDRGAPISRREAMHRGLAGAAGLLLAGHQAAGAPAEGQSPKAKSVIQIWAAGGPPHLDTFDPKPDAGNDYCGPLIKPISTNVDGIRIGELLPMLAKQADKYSIIRSMTHGNNGHETASYLVSVAESLASIFLCLRLHKKDASLFYGWQSSKPTRRTRMRRKMEAVLRFEWNNDHLPKIVREYREKYKGISRILDENPDILDLAHEDLKDISEGNQNNEKGRKGDFTSDTILRALVVHAIGGDSLRETVIHIAESDFLQDFLRTRKKAVMDYSFLDKCFKVIRPETWKRINETLVARAVVNEEVDPSVIRTDTTAVETNIHWPTDSSLLWDTYSVAARLIRSGYEKSSEDCPYRFHEKKIRKLYLDITRFSNSKNKKRRRQLKEWYRTLVERVGTIVEKAEALCKYSRKKGDFELLLAATELANFLPSMKTVVEQARRAQVDGEKVPAAERVFSIFEPHTELIMRGRRSKPIEFGHMVLLCQSQQKIITDYDVMEEKIADCHLTEKVIDRHERLFGQTPEVLAGDKGFCPNSEKYAELEERVATLAIPKRLRDLADTVMKTWQMFRAGIEGTISGLKRAFRLSRCFYRGFKSFESAVGLGIFSHNLVVLTKMGGS